MFFNYKQLSLLFQAISGYIVLLRLANNEGDVEELFEMQKEIGKVLLDYERVVK
jgi:hypothetical protein